MNGTRSFRTRAAAFALTRPQLVTLSMTAIVAAALTFRVGGLATYGLNDDEVTKFRAAESYSRGAFTVNAEHPMLMKLAVWGSVSASNRWNDAVPSRYRIPVEAAVRLPNAIAGTASVVLLYGVGQAYFGTAVGLIAALLLALEPSVTSINRLAKEDTFVVFFFLLAVWLYERGKQVGARDRLRAQRWYMGSAAAFAATVASKYLPHFYGLYSLANVVTQRDAGPNSPIKRRFFATLAVAFATANFAIFLPSAWAHVARYLQGAGMGHHGWPYAGRLWVTDVPISPLGVPPTFYLMYLLTRLPLVTLISAAVGAVVAASRRRERGYVFLRIFLVFQLIGYSAMAAKFIRYGLPILVVFNLMAAVGFVAAVTRIAQRAKSELRGVVVSVAYGALALLLFAAQAQASPFFSMHRATLARWLDPDGRRFPEAAYDYGVREAVSEIAASAAPEAVIVSDVPQVVRFYVNRTARPDLREQSLSGSGLSGNGTEQWVLVQDAHVYFETDELIKLLRLRHRPVKEYRINGVTVLQVFRISGA